MGEQDGQIGRGTSNLGRKAPNSEAELENLKDVDAGSSRGGKNPTQHSVPFYKLFSFADGFDYLLIFLGTLGACTHGAAIPVFFIFFGKLIDEFGANYNNLDRLGHGVSKYALYFVYLGLVILGAAWMEVACWTQTGERQAARMRISYLRAMLKQDVGFFDTDTSTGEIVNGISSDTVLVQEAIGAKAGNYIHYMARFLSGFIVGFLYVWQLTLVTVAVVPAIAVAGGIYAHTMVGLTSKNQKAYAKAGGIAEETLSQIRTVHSFVGEEKAISLYANALQTTYKIGKKGGLAKGLGVGTTYGLTIGAWALLLWYAGVLVRRGVTNGGEAFTTILNVVISGLSLGNAAPNLAAFGKGRAAGYTILEMIKRKPGIDSSSNQGKQLSNVNGHLEFQNIRFSYPSRPDICVFEGLCLDIPAGKTVAIVGSSGSGKSTIVSLIERFYDPQSGAVLLDGHDIKTLQLKWLRSRIGLVSQEPALFATSIRKNILFGKESATNEDIELAARISDADIFIKQLPRGYDTLVGEKGVQLSGGQKQRIAIARAMIKDPTILLLDEATSALDAESEHAVQQSLDRLMVGRTTVVVAHRLSTIKDADMIAVVQHGKVVEIGSHDDLMAKGSSGAYSALVRLQTNAKDVASEDLVVTKREKHGRTNSMSQRAFSFRSSVPSDVESQSNVELDEFHKQKVFAKPSFTRLLKLNVEEWPYALAGSIGAILAGAETPFFAYGITQVLISFYYPDKNHQRHEIEKISMIFAVATILTVVIYILEHYFFGVMGERLTMRVRKMMFTAILRNEVGWFDREENNSSLLSSRLASDASMVRAAVGDRMSTLVQNFALIVTGFVMAFVLQWKLTLVILALFPLMIGAHLAEHLFLKGFGMDLNKAYCRATMIAGEAVANIRTVAAFNAADKILDLFSCELEGPKSSSFVRGQIAGLGYGLSQCFLYSSYGLALWYASKLVRKGETSFSPIMKSFVLLIFTAFGVAETLALAPDIIKGSDAIGSVFDILDYKTEIDPDDSEASIITHVNGEIELRHVSFSYPTRQDILVFEDLNLKVCAGRSIALVGSSGSGKSSIIGLISRFYDPVSGKVLIDGRDIKRVNLRSLRQHIGLVQQEPALFATTIYENILYGKPEATESEVLEAAKAANAHTFISGLTDGYKTDVGERGVQLSGGQKQRVAIARAVLKNPAILLLDEATSALDAQSEKIVQAALDRLMSGRTTVMVAHRLSTIKNADAIAVLQSGKIVEQGSHDDLIFKSGAYANLVSLQQNRK